MKFTSNIHSYKQWHSTMIGGLLVAILSTSMVHPVEAISFKLPTISSLFGISASGIDESPSQQTFPDVADSEPRTVVWAIMTAYSSDVGQTDATPCIPADWTYNLCENYEKTGARDTIAANFLPMGTKVRFPDMYGDKIFTVRDRMNARYGQGRGDIWMPSRAEAVTFGVRRMKMEIYYR